MRGMSWEKHQQTSFRSMSVVCIYIKPEISTVFHHNVSRWTVKQHRTDLLRISRPLEPPPTCCYTQWDLSRVEHSSWLSLIPFWLEANCILFKTSHLFSLSSSKPFPQQQDMAPRIPQHGASGSELSPTTGASFNEPPAKRKQQCRYELVHHDAANAATDHVTQDAHWKRVHRNGSSRNKEQLVIGCE